MTRLALALVSLVAAPAIAGEPLRLAAGTGAVDDRVARALVDRVGQDALDTSLRAVAATGEADALADLRADKADLALTRMDLAFDAWAGKSAAAAPELRLVAVLHPVRVHVLADRALAGRGVSALAGQRVALPTTESGDAATAFVPFAMAGLNGPARLQLSRLDGKPALAALRAHAIDALVLVVADDDPTLAEARAAGAVDLALPPQTEQALAAFPSFTVEDGVATTTAVVLAKEALPARAAQAVVRAVAGKSLPVTPLALAVGATRAALPFHDGSLAALEAAGALPFPVKVYVGLYAYSITELDLGRGTYLLDALVWFRWRGPQLGNKSFEFTFPNGTVESQEDSPVVEEGEYRRQSKRVTVRLRASFVLRDYPFDTQVLPLALEHRWLGDKRLQFVPDDGAIPAGRTLRTAFLGPDVHVQDWRITDVRHHVEVKQYETDFGSIQKGVWDGKSSRYEFEATIRRPIVPYVIKIILPLIVILLITLSVFFLPRFDLGVDASIIVTALLACVASHFAQASSLPDVGYLVRADMFFLLSYFVIFVTLALTVVENRLVAAEREDAAVRLKRVARWTLPPLALAGMLVLCLL